MYQPSVSVPKAGSEQGSEVRNDVHPRRYHLCVLKGDLCQGDHDVPPRPAAHPHSGLGGR
jgi:hypothetical protein